MNKWEKDRIFETKGIRKIVENLEMILFIKRTFERLNTHV